MTYLPYFGFPASINRVVYPDKLIDSKQLACINFKPITILYGNNGSGKSTILNLIAERIGIKNKTLGNTTEHFDHYAWKCDIDPGTRIPPEATFIRSEDIMEMITSIRKENAAIDKKVLGWFDKGLRGDGVEEARERHYEAKRMLEGVNEGGHGQDSFMNMVSGVLFMKKEEESNGETAMRHFKETLFDNNLYLLDEPENSMAPEYQKSLASYISILAYRMNTQFIIATHSPFMLSIPEAIIYDLDHAPCKCKKWYELDNMIAYYNLFSQHRENFEKQN